MIRIISFNITIIFSFRAVLKVAAIVKWLNYISSKLSTGTLENGKQIFAKPRFEYPSDKIKFPKILLKISLIATNQIFMKRSTQPSRRYFMQILSLPFVNKPCSRFNLTLVEGRRPLALRPSVKTLTLFIKNGFSGGGGQPTCSREGEDPLSGLYPSWPSQTFVPRRPRPRRRRGRGMDLALK